MGAGHGYLGVADRVKQAMIFSFDPVTGRFDPLFQGFPYCFPLSIDVDPTTGDLWWFSCDSVHRRDAQGRVVDFSIPPNTTNKFLNFGPDGTLYSVLWFGVSDQTIPPPHGLYRRESDGRWTEMVDLTTNDPFITWAIATACPNRTIYLSTGVSESVLDRGRPPEPGPGGFSNSLLRLEPDQTLALLAYDLPSDTFAMDCDSKTGDVVLATMAGPIRASWMK